jgi:hypothetical protein
MRWLSSELCWANRVANIVDTSKDAGELRQDLK